MIILVFSSVFRISADSVVTNSGSFNLSFSDSSGMSDYTIEYRYPSEVQIGQNLTVAVSVFVDELTGLKLYVSDWAIVATVIDSNGHPQSGKFSSQTVQNFLYQGSHRGPVNISIPITIDNFSSDGHDFGAQITIQWIADVQYDSPYNQRYYESNQQGVGNITVLAYSQKNSMFSLYYSLAGVLALIIGGLVIAHFRKRIHF
jgi:hypothetical protein